MDVVQNFLRLRREGKGEEAYELLAPGASLGCPWGGMQHGERVHDILVNEAHFVRKDYLNDVPVEQITENTFQRKFYWDRGIFEHGNSGIPYFRWLPQWREIYFVHEGKITLVTSDKQLRNRTISHLLGFT